MIEYGLKGKTAIVTGTNNPQGIGATTAIAFAKEEVKLVLVYKKIQRKYDESKTGCDGFNRYFKANNGDMSAVEKELRSINADYLVIEGDISDEQFVKSVYERATERFGKVDILVNNAAAGDEYGNDTIEKITQNIIDETFNVNVKGTLLMTREFVKRRGNYGRIINLSTDAAQVFAGQITYGASKAAVEALTRSIALEIGKYGITVNCVAPGPIQTGWIDEELEKSCLPKIPIGRIGLPQDIANTILFLSSVKADWLTGQVIKVSGGDCL